MKVVKKLWKVLKFSFKHRKLVFSLMLAICFVSAYNGIIKENKEIKTMQEAQREKLRKGVSLQENVLSNSLIEVTHGDSKEEKGFFINDKKVVDEVILVGEELYICPADLGLTVGELDGTTVSVGNQYVSYKLSAIVQNGKTYVSYRQLATGNFFQKLKYEKISDTEERITYVLFS